MKIIRQTFSAVLLAVLASGCATERLCHSQIGIRDEVASGITQAYLTSNGNVLVTFHVENREWGREPELRSAMYDLHVTEGARAPVLIDGKRVDAYQQVRPARLDQSILSAPPLSTAIPVLSKPDLPEVVLQTTPAAVAPSTATWYFYAYRRKEDPKKAQVFTCNFPVERWETWWRTPVMIVAAPAALATDIVCLPVYAIGFVGYASQMRGYSGGHGP